MEDYQWSEAEKAPMTDEAVEMVMDRLNKLTSEEENNGKMHPLRKGPGNPGEDR